METGANDARAIAGSTLGLGLEQIGARWLD